MGIPAAFRWLSNKYPKIISPVIEQTPIVTEDGITIPVDTTQPNPNGEELDNLYLDMNGIVHPCSHPEDRPAPADEEEMMLEVFKYTDRVVNMVRPRKILMIAVDGVAPRAKMNQQRSRRFRSAQEAKEKEEDKQALIELLKRQNGGTFAAADSETVVKKAFDSNSITPGTPFMDILALSLRYWCQYKLNTDPAWAKLKIIISDATVPGEGEHKIMNFVRSQRASPNYDPNTRHVIYGLDADLIMLGLATHEPHFRVLREDVFFQDGKNRACKLCGQKGHEANNCRGNAKPSDDPAAAEEQSRSLQSPEGEIEEVAATMEDHIGITMVGMGLATLVGTEIREDLIPGTIGTTNASTHIIPTKVCLNMGGGNHQLGQGLTQEPAPLQLQICSTNRSKVGMGTDPSMATREDTEGTLERGLLTAISGADVVINDRHNSLSARPIYLESSSLAGCLFA
ncbi:hypothetical protein TRIATDRAFT_280608 [Trichoderma atroviride IMI 206040]|uniref:CCHC-type domain-containing protein n=1 Tax=Hypocrea atroviridis (strain ATCC 20476 / IMI 206040) TaxID=452589 RepID=G9NHM7_HYPAI|nr:uncharacterized protein TRIATDRAFT_280608 [Trichoderma atroviride IMI 206040]EHK50119.1 hypothetical protein TRIATDRAFT_280608 [Trichoderma atroviride IMI 206040]